MSQERLSEVAILSIEKDILIKLLASLHLKSKKNKF